MKVKHSAIRSLVIAVASLFFVCLGITAHAGLIPANLTFTADDEYQVFLNGVLVRENIGISLRDPSRSAPPRLFFDPAPATVVTLYDDQPNVIAVWAWDYYGVEDMLSGEVRLPNGALATVTSELWKATGAPAPGNWWEPGYDDSSWGQAIKLGVNDGNGFPWRTGGIPIPGIDPSAEYIWAGGVSRGQGLASTAYFRTTFNVPEPSTLFLLGLGLPAIVVLGKKRLSEHQGTNHDS